MFAAAPGKQRMLIMCVLLLGQRRRRWPNIKPTQGRCPVLVAGKGKSAKTSLVDVNTWLASELDNIAKALFLYVRSTVSWRIIG